MGLHITFAVFIGFRMAVDQCCLSVTRVAD
jgi:hypothetical protein